MNKTKIEWTDYTINPIKGLCQNNCWYCYARAMYKRFKWNPKIRLDLDCFYNVEKIKKPSKIFVCSTHEIMGSWITNNWINEIIFRTEILSWHTFIFLTKFPKRYLEFMFPKNCWLGTTITGIEKHQSFRHGVFSGIDNIKFISYEPLLAEPEPIIKYLSLDWIIIGGLTPKPRHKKEWVQNLINQARRFNIPIFIKDNLEWHEKIQEFPDSNINFINKFTKEE